MSSSGFCFIPARKIAAVDTTAAGDCFIGVLAAGLDEPLSLDAAMVRATAAAGLCCMRRGSQSSLPWQDDIIHRLQQQRRYSQDPWATDWLLR